MSPLKGSNSSQINSIAIIASHWLSGLVLFTNKNLKFEKNIINTISEILNPDIYTVM